MIITINSSSYREIIKELVREINILLIDKYNKVTFIEISLVEDYIKNNFDIGKDTVIEYNKLFNDIRNYLKL